MAFNAYGFKTITHIGSIDGSAGTNRAKHCYFAGNDDAAAVETAGYFNAVSARVQIGDSIEVTGDVDGTPFGRTYVVSGNAAGVVAVTRFAADTAA